MTDPNSIPEINARARARGDYFRWLRRRYGGIDLIEVQDDPSPISLRDIFIPLQLDTEDRDDDALGHDTPLKDETPPGTPAWDLVLEHPFLAISGRPGSGKTTLVKALMLELLSERPSRLRDGLARADRPVADPGTRPPPLGIAPIPLILRNLRGLNQVMDLGDLLGLWWQQELAEAKDKGMPLDEARLRYSFDPDGEGYPLLLLFDGIDEVGGSDIRSKVLVLASEAVLRGHRVVVTGRPGGFSGVDPEAVDLRASEDIATIRSLLDGVSATDPPARQMLLRFDHEPSAAELERARRRDAEVPGLKRYDLQPLAGPQILSFIERWYRLRDEWAIQRETGIRVFTGALERQPYLRTLARRPIFLTLMASVHVSRSRMPEGRAELYREIVELYLVRQDHHRRRRYTLDGREMPDWPAAEKRIALGHLAWRSQLRGAGAAEERAERDDRRVVWPRDDLLAELRDLLGGRAGVRFRTLTPADAEELLRYYLHPAGLLVEPAEGQVQLAHLSFQEYLCADYLHGRAIDEGLSGFLGFLDRELFAHLGEPGWDEIALILFTLHAEQGQGRGHLELLSRLDLARPAHAAFFISVYTGGELPFDPEDREAWLPAAVIACLLHPELELAERLKRLPVLSDAGLSLLKDLFASPDDSALWGRLEAALEERRPHGLPRGAIAAFLAAPARRWDEPPAKDSGWASPQGAGEARGHALLVLANLSGWVRPAVRRPEWNPIGDPDLSERIAAWLKARVPDPGRVDLLFAEYGRLPLPTRVAEGLDGLVPESGALWDAVLARFPADLWLLQGESGDPEAFELLSMPPVLLGLYPASTPAPRTRLSLGLYQSVLCVEGAAEGRAFDEYSLSRSLSRSRSTSRSLLLFLSRSLPQSQSRSRSRSLPRSGWQSRSLLRSLLRSLSRTWWWSRLLSWSWPWSLLLSLSHQRQLSSTLRSLLARVADVSADTPRPSAPTENWRTALEHFGYRFAALDWFDEQAESPDLMRRRGLHPGEPLPAELGLFDPDGRPLPVQHRGRWQALLRWLDDDDAILGFLFTPGELTADEERVLRADLARLRTRPWSPARGVEAILADWPPDRPTLEYTLEAAERPLIAAGEALLAELKP